MRKIITLFTRSIAIFIVSLGSLGQADAEEPQKRSDMLRFGGFLGGGFVDWVGKDADGTLPGAESAPKPGFSAGLQVTVDLSTLLSLGIEPFHLALQPELVYSMKGSKFFLNGEDRDASTNMTYLQVGLLARAEYDISERVTPYALVGPALGFLRQVEFRNRFGDAIDTSDDYKSTDFSLILGLGTLYSFPPWGAASLELRADLGLVSIAAPRFDDEVRNAALLLLLGYLY